MAEFILFIIVVGVISFIAFVISSMMKAIKTGEEEAERVRKIYQKYGVPDEELNPVGMVNGSLCVSGGGLLKGEDLIYIMWGENGVLKFVCVGEQDEYAEIPIDNIICFFKEGNETYVSEISGGGGGGSSLGGAVVGGMLAGGTGAIIGSRKKTENIHTEIRRIDNQQTSIIVKLEQNNTSIIFKGVSMYNKLLKICPHKEREVISSSLNEIESVENKLQKLKNLYEENLITEKEYQEKKQDLLSQM